MASPILTADTSAVLPLLLQWHPLHEAAVDAMKSIRRLPAHVLAESFSVLTRLPAPRAASPELALQALNASFPEAPIALSAAGYLLALDRLAEARLGGGRVYDAIVGATAVEAGARLITADRRALPTYALVGAEVQVLG